MKTRTVVIPKPLGPAETTYFESVQLDRKGDLVRRLPGEARQVVEVLGDGVALELVAIPKGFFQMGARHEGGYEDERPLHPVFLNAFWMGRYLVTQAQWQTVMGRLPLCRFHGPDLPVENICWKNAVAFCERLSGQTGRCYGLPSEAQWEYACRAGTNTPFSLGETITTDYVNYVGNHTYCEAPVGVYRHNTTPGGTFPPNPWGLYDMHGNLWEFCQDPWSDDYTGAPVDGQALTTKSSWRVARGGSWHETPLHCRSAMRLRVEEGDWMECYGMRVCLQEAENGR